MKINRFLFFGFLVFCVWISFSFVGANKISSLDNSFIKNVEELSYESVIPDDLNKIKQEMVFDEIIMPVAFKYVDYDNDGNLDLVRKERNNKIYVYINKGTTENSIYKEGQLYEGEEIIFDEKGKETLVLESSAKWTPITYDRFNVYIDEDYYNANTPAIDEFFNEFEERYLELELFTGWTSEESYDDKKLRIIVQGTATGCYGGSGGMGDVLLYLSDPLYMSGCEMPYYVDGIPYFGNPGELGDWWRYMGVAMHEATHGTNPEPILDRNWLTEGFATYNEYNILSNYNGNEYLDINQETADHFIYAGDSAYNWEDYVANDYHDTTTIGNCGTGNCEIQESSGYRITSWMFSMLRDDYSLDWSSFFNLMNNNYESLYKAWELGGGGDDSYFTDAHVIDVFGRALDMDFSTIQTIFQYDGPEGPGWGVRNWESLDWYADLSSGIDVSVSELYIDQNVDLDVVVYNNGGVDLENVLIKVQSIRGGCVQTIYEDVINVVSYGNYEVSGLSFSEAYRGNYSIVVSVDEENIKIESNEINNNAYSFVNFIKDCTLYFDKYLGEWVNPCSDEYEPACYSVSENMV